MNLGAKVSVNLRRITKALCFLFFWTSFDARKDHPLIIEFMFF